MTGKDFRTAVGGLIWVDHPTEKVTKKDDSGKWVTEPK
jgi:hypothetical protein